MAAVTEVVVLAGGSVATEMAEEPMEGRREAVKAGAKVEGVTAVTKVVAMRAVRMEVVAMEAAAKAVDMAVVMARVVAGVVMKAAMMVVATVAEQAVETAGGVTVVAMVAVVKVVETVVAMEEDCRLGEVVSCSNTGYASV